MSKKEDAKKQGKTKAVASKQQKKKTAIIIAVAAVVVAAVVLLSVFVIAPWVREKQYEAKPPVTHDISSVDNQLSDRYEYVDFRGLTMPKQVAEILNQAEIDNAKACAEYGVAAVVGDHQVSRPEFEMFYNYSYSDKASESLYQDIETKMNTTGFNYNLSPQEQDYPGSDVENYMWSDRFTDLALLEMQYTYAAFECAVENKVQLSENLFQQMIYEYEDVIQGAQRNGQTLEEFLNSRVGEHVTYEMYAAYGIMKYYASQFQETEIEKYKQTVTDVQLDNYYKENVDSLKLAKLRIYPIETEEYDEAALAKVKDEASFLEFAQNTNVYGDIYNAESVTEYWWVDKYTVSSRFGDPVGDWAFEAGRKKGDIKLVQGTIFKCLVYVDTPAYETVTRQVAMCEYYIANPDDEVLIEENKKGADEVQAYYVDNGKTKDALQYLIDETFLEEKAVSISDYGIEIDKWLFDPARKEGDYVRIDNSDGSYFFYYIGENSEDYDWKRAARETIALEEYDKAFADRVEKNFNAEKASEKSIAAAWKHAYDIMKPYVEERKQLNGLK